MSKWKYRYLIKRKLRNAEYLSLMNYTLAYNSEKKSFVLTFKSFRRTILNLIVSRFLYRKKPDVYEGKSYFIDFDDRHDHLKKVNEYVGRLKLGSLSLKKTYKSRDYIAKSKRYKCLKIFCSLFFLMIYIAYVKKLNFFYVLEALAKFSRNYTLGEALAANVKLDAIFSLNLQTSLGFVFGLKSIKNNIKIVTIQHGFITKLNGVNSSKWRDYYSDFYICWTDEFKTIALSRFSGKCKLIVDGGVFDVNCNLEGLPQSDEKNNNSILFLSSFSAYTNQAIIDQEVRVIYRLFELCKGSDFDLTVRLHPSIEFDSKVLPHYINVELPSEISLEGAISKAGVVCTISSSSIIISAIMKKRIMIVESINENILNLSLSTADIYSTDSLLELIRHYSHNLKDFKFMYGVQTNSIENMMDLYRL